VKCFAERFLRSNNRTAIKDNSFGHPALSRRRPCCLVDFHSLFNAQPPSVPDGYLVLCNYAKRATVRRYVSTTGRDDACETRDGGQLIEVTRSNKSRIKLFTEINSPSSFSRIKTGSLTHPRRTSRRSVLIARNKTRRAL